MKKLALSLAVFLPLCLLLSVLAYNIPPIHDRLAWRIDDEILRIRYTLHPPEKVIFVPQETALATPTQRPSPTPTEEPAASPLPTHIAPSPSPTVLPTATPLPLPAQALIQNVPYEDQHGRYNYCAPSNLAMALSFWGWKGNRDTVGPFLKPDAKDKNVMPYEMVNYIQDHTDLHVAHRIAGDLDLLKRFVAAGFPVLVEKGTYLTDLTGVVSWMGHYEVVIGYDDAGSFFITQDSYIGPNYKVPYDEMITNWRAFDYTYLIVYPPAKEDEVMRLLGPDADESYNNHHAYEKASQEIYQTTGIDQFFAWFNRGSSLVALQDYAGAAKAYDQAFSTVYPTIPEKKRPWRMLWYQTGPYFAYFYSGRYYDVVTLANNTLDAMQSDKNLEESYYWRGMAELALGDQKSAVEDFQTSLKFHKDFGPSVYELKQLGVVS
jgi:tetratricopeptide (TPR) repeat protein